MADVNVPNYTEQGGARTVIRGSLDIASGGDLDIESGASLKIAGTAVTLTAVKINKAVQSTTAGAVITGGEIVISGSTSFATGLTSVVAVQASQVSDPTTLAYWATAAKGTTAGWILLKSYAPTSSADVTPAAGSTSTTVSWHAIGA